jgi:hypothetical protein
MKCIVDDVLLSQEEYFAKQAPWANEDPALHALRGLSHIVNERENIIILQDNRTGQQFVIPIDPNVEYHSNEKQLRQHDQALVSKILTFENRHLFKDISIAEKEIHCLPVINNIYEYANIARTIGFSEMKDRSDAEKCQFTRMAIKLVFDMHEGSSLREQLENHIITSKYEGVELLCKLLIVEGVLRIHAGSSPILIREHLEFIVGDDVFKIWRCQACEGCEATDEIEYGLRVPRTIYCPRRDGYMGTLNKEEFILKLANRVKQSFLEANLNLDELAKLPQEVQRIDFSKLSYNDLCEFLERHPECKMSADEGDVGYVYPDTPIKVKTC